MFNLFDEGFANNLGAIENREGLSDKYLVILFKITTTNVRL